MNSGILISKWNIFLSINAKFLTSLCLNDEESNEFNRVLFHV